MVVSFYVHYPREDPTASVPSESDQVRKQPKSFVTLLESQLNNRAETSVMRRLLTLCKYMLRQYNALIFHAILNLILTFDRKDWTTMCLFAVEAVTIPVHVLLLFRSTTQRPKYPAVFYSALPVLGCCVLLAFFRYTLYFQK